MSDTISTSDLFTNPNPAGFNRPLVAVDVVVFTLLENDLKVLLIRRDSEPFSGTWAIPGGLIDINESLEAAARRIMVDKTGVHDVFVEQLFTFGDVHRDPRARVVSVTYFALVQPDKLPEQRAPLTIETAWMSVYHLPELAFDHITIVSYALTRLRYKLEYSAVAFELMPEEFTLRELQDAYMIILNDHTLDKANFRKKLRYEPPIIEPTGIERKTKGRPAALYRFREDAKREVKARRLFP
jgi:8-oxo-dGTP diphosphatase